MFVKIMTFEKKTSKYVFEWKWVCACLFLFVLLLLTLNTINLSPALWEILNYQEKEGRDPINQFDPATFVCLFQARAWISNAICYGFFYLMIWGEVIVCFVDISGIVDHHCLEMIVCYVDIGGIVDHHCLEVIVCFVDISGIVDHHCLEMIVLLILLGLLTINV